MSYIIMYDKFISICAKCDVSLNIFSYDIIFLEYVICKVNFISFIYLFFVLVM